MVSFSTLKLSTLEDAVNSLSKQVVNQVSELKARNDEPKVKFAVVEKKGKV